MKKEKFKPYKFTFIGEDGEIYVELRACTDIKDANVTGQNIAIQNNGRIIQIEKINEPDILN